MVTCEFSFSVSYTVLILGFPVLVLDQIPRLWSKQSHKFSSCSLVAQLVFCCFLGFRLCLNFFVSFWILNEFACLIAHFRARIFLLLFFLVFPISVLGQIQHLWSKQSLGFTCSCGSVLCRTSPSLFMFPQAVKKLCVSLLISELVFVFTVLWGVSQSVWDFSLFPLIDYLMMTGLLYKVSLQVHI